MAHCAVIRRFVSIWRRGLPLQRPDIPHHKHQNPSEGVEDAIDREFNDLFDQWRKLTNEILSEPTERYEIGESVLLGKAISYPAQVNSVIGVYLKSLYEDADRQAAYKAATGRDLAPPDTWEEYKAQAIFFTDAPNFYGTQYAGKDEAIVGRYYELVIAEGGQLFNDDWSPAFNSDAGKRALSWFVDLYQAGAVPPGTTSYLWDDLGQGFASGTIALNLDWPGWAGFFNGEDTSKAAGDVGVKVQPAGSTGIRTGWSGHHGFSVTESCDHKEAAVSLVAWLTNEDSQKLESAGGSLPTRTAVWEHVLESVKSDPYRAEAIAAFQEGSEHAFPAPQTPYWIEATNLIYPELQAAILGDKSIGDALSDAADAVDEMMQENGVY